MTKSRLQTSPTVPSPPRTIPKWFFVRRMQAMFFFGCFLLVFPSLLSIPFLAIGGWVLPTADFWLDHDHVTTSAVVTDVHFHSKTRINNKNPWRISFEFVDYENSTIQARGYTFDPRIGSSVPGDTIDIEYDPGKPTRARPVGGQASLMPLWLYLVILLPMTLIGLACLLKCRINSRRERNLLTHGDGVAAEVIGTRIIRSIHFNRKHPIDVQYRFEDYTGQQITGKDRTYHYAWALALKPGDTVGVVYDPMNPGNNVLWLHGKELR